jgi:hypothetical protein
VGEASHENTGEAKCDVLGVIDQSVERKRYLGVSSTFMTLLSDS